MHSYHIESTKFRPGFIPVNLATGSNASLARVDMSECDLCHIIIYKDKGAAAEPVVLTLSQHKEASAGTPAALEIKNGVYVMAHADLEALHTFTKEANDGGSNTNRYTGTSSIEKEAFIVIPVYAEDLDTDGGYRYLSAAVADVGDGAQIAGMFYQQLGLRYAPPVEPA